MSELQKTFSIIKPDAVASGKAGKILSLLEENGFRIVGLRMTKLSQSQAEGFYGVHRERPFFGSLVKFMTEGPVIVMALEREDAVRKLREVMGATNPANAAEGTVRKLYAESIERNAIHGASPYSAAARFETGLLDSADWKGKWIGGANQMRTEFTLAGRPVRARAYVAGVGFCELRINGRKVGDHVLDPAWTTYDKRVLYTVYDITERLRPGANAVGVMLGEGWFKSRALRMQIHAEMEGGQTVDVATDAMWKTMPGPIQSDSVYNGEVYDARLETPGWDRAGFDDAHWKAANLIDGPKGVLSAQMMPPIRVVDTIAPVKMTTTHPGVYIYDLGQNISGVVEMRVRGPRGTRVQMRHAELLYDDGTLNVENLRAAKATDVYILRGDGSLEVYQPRFTYHGFRYVELTGYPGAPKFDTLRAKVVHSDVRPTGGFTSSKQILNQIQRNIVWGIQDNLTGVPTDCNQRDERMGWMADAHLYAETAMLNFDMPAFYTNFLRDIHDVQGADGTVTDTVPHRYGSRPADPAWGMAYPLLT